MFSIRGIYKLPSVKQVFVIVSSLGEFLDNLLLSQMSKLRKECFEHILRLIDRINPKEALQWTIKVVSEHDFLMELKQHNPIGQVLTNRTFHSPDTLELLTISQVKNLEPSLDMSFFTPKALNTIQDEDIIEIFI